MKIVTYCAGLTLLVVVGWLLWPEPPVTNYPSSGTEIIAFGDSLIEGVGATTGNDLVSRLETLVGVPIVNLGVSGDTTAEGLARVNQVTERDPQVVILLLGGNDAIQQAPLLTTEANLTRVIEEFHEAGAVVLLLGVRSGILQDSYDDMYEDLAKTHGTAFVPNVLRGIFGRPALMADLIHPNDDGYEKLAERVAPVLVELIQ